MQQQTKEWEWSNRTDQKWCRFSWYLMDLNTHTWNVVPEYPWVCSCTHAQQVRFVLINWAGPPPRLRKVESGRSLQHLFIIAKSRIFSANIQSGTQPLVESTSMYYQTSSVEDTTASRLVDPFPLHTVWPVYSCIFNEGWISALIR